MATSPPDAAPDPGSPQGDAGHSFAERLAQRYGPGVDPEVSLGDGPVADHSAAPASTSPSSDALISRLKAHAPGDSRYKLEGEVARGGMGAILRIWDADLRRHLAMKVVLGRSETPGPDGTPGVEPHQLARFLEEAQVTGQLDHPGIVPVHELGLDAEGRVYFTMKLVKGRDLKQVFDLVHAGQEGWNETRAISVMLRVCEALAYAHKKGVIHRDLKPANVMVGHFGEVYVMDWGLARVLGRKDSHDLRLRPEAGVSLTSVRTERREDREDQPDSPIVTMDGDVVGTPAYMPPEQARGEIEKLSPRGDVYAIGAMLYHLLARQAPYLPKGARVSARTLLSRVLDKPPQPLAEIRRDIPAELIAICEKAMAREPGQRYADTLELAEDLRSFLEHRVVGAYETGAWAETRKWIERNKPLAASLGGAIVLLVAGLFTSLLYKSRADENARDASRNATQARESAALARANELRAQEQERLATAKTNDVLSLSAIQELRELEARADRLWPATPDKLPAYDEWVADVRVLIEGRPEGEGKPKHASLQEHLAKLAEIRTLARPRSREQEDADRRASPLFAIWEAGRRELTWFRRMLGEEPWPTEPEAEAMLAAEKLPADARALNSLAWRLVDPDAARIVYGSELEGLLLARRAVALATDADRSAMRDTLAWALFRCGRFEEALAEQLRAQGEALGAQVQALAASGQAMRAQIASWKPRADDADAAELRARRQARLVRLAPRVETLGRLVNLKQTLQFDNAQDRWWHTQLENLLLDLCTLTNDTEGAAGLYSTGTSGKHGWGILKRREFAATIEERSLTGAEARARWEQALAAIARNERYAGFGGPGAAPLVPQLGLLPLGEDPLSHLWEFWHLQSGSEPRRGGDGRLALAEDSGIVLVLIPGGSFTLGAQAQDPARPNHDPAARPDETPFELALAPYFLSKYEMTQAQWSRFAGVNPSGFRSGWTMGGRPLTGLNPVEQVSWLEGAEVLARMGLAHPTEAQWEFACRAGGDTPWNTGAERASLRGRANLADRAADREGFTWADIRDWPELDDGFPVHAPVGSFPANAFGLHEMHGNVWEWCRDWMGRTTTFASGDGERLVANGGLRISRGGSYVDGAGAARSANRSNAHAPANQDTNLGLRPARAIRSQATFSPAAGSGGR